MSLHRYIGRRYIGSGNNTVIPLDYRVIHGQF